MLNTPLHPAIVWMLRVQFVALILAATYACLTPRPQDLISFNAWDKAMHFVGWCGIFLSLRVAMLLANRVKRSALGVFAYSALLESLQSLVPGRHFELYDLLANGLGIAAGALLWYFLMQTRWLKKPALH